MSCTPAIESSGDAAERGKGYGDQADCIEKLKKTAIMAGSLLHGESSGPVGVVENLRSRDLLFALKDTFATSPSGAFFELPSSCFHRKLKSVVRLPLEPGQCQGKKRK